MVGFVRRSDCDLGDKTETRCPQVEFAGFPICGRLYLMVGSPMPNFLQEITTGIAVEMLVRVATY